jgi:hypothetical protein
MAGHHPTIHGWFQVNYQTDKVNDEGLPLSVTFEKDALVPLHHHFISGLSSTHNFGSLATHP